MEGCSSCRKHFPRSSAATSSPSHAKARPRCARSRRTSESEEGCLHRWLKIADRDDGIERGTATKTGLDESAELREARKRIKLLAQEAEVMRRAVAYLSRDVNAK